MRTETADPIPEGRSGTIPKTIPSSSPITAEDSERSTSEINVTVDFSTDTAAQLHRPVVSYLDASLAEHDLAVAPLHAGDHNGTFSFTMDKALFHHGEGNETLLLNFERNTSVARNPLRYSVTHLQAFVDAAMLDSVLGKSVTYLYARAYAPEQIASGKKMKANIFYEVYCKGCDMAAYNLAGMAESDDHVNWFTLPDTETFHLDFNAPESSDYQPHADTDVSSGIEELTRLEKLDRKHIMIEVSKTPMVSKITYKPLSYLIYNAYRSGVTTQSFIVHFNATPKSWAGRGSEGLTVDTQISTRDAFDKIDW